MADYLGDRGAIALQVALRARVAEFADQPLLSNGGRILNILDVESYGWDKVRADATRDGVIGLTMVDRDQTLAKLHQIFGDDMDFPYWDVFTGPASEVVATCERLTAHHRLPAHWSVISLTDPEEAQIEACQELNQATGVAPTPAYYLKGEHVPSLLTCLHDAGGRLVACANASMRYHVDSPLAGWVFAGAVSVAPEYRRMGLGAYINAALLRDAHQVWGWSHALEQARATNTASVGMITACGLKLAEGKATIWVNLNGGFQTR